MAVIGFARPAAEATYWDSTEDWTKIISRFLRRTYRGALFLLTHFAWRPNPLVMSMQAPNLLLLDLPEEILFHVAVHVTSGPNAHLHSTALPLACAAFRRICASKAIMARRLVARVRSVVGARHDPLDDLAANRAWGTAAEVHAFVFGGGSSCREAQCERTAALLAVEPGTADCLHAILRRCSIGESLAPARPPNAEELFLAHETERQCGRAATSPPQRKLQARPSTGRPPTRGRECEAAMRSAEQTLVAREFAKQQLVAAEIERQTRRQLGAHIRRLWAQMPSSDRRAWERQAAEAQGRLERQRRIACSARELSTRLAEIMACSEAATFKA